MTPAARKPFAPKSALPTVTPTVGIVGGGLAGLAAAAALLEKNFRVELFEARRRLGGRAGSFLDPAAQELVDHCQHVSMGCCTALAEFCRRTGVEPLMERHERLHFFGPDGRRYDLAATPLLPAPLHLASSLLGLGYLTWGERLSVARTLLLLARESPRDESGGPTIGQWLVRHRQSEAAMRRFWGVVLVSALGESLERASLAAARKVFVDGFMRSRDGYQILTPRVPLGELYDRVADHLRRGGATIHLETPVKQVVVDSPIDSRSPATRASGLRLADGEERSFDFVVVAVPWRRVRGLFSEPALASLPELAGVERIGSSPITSLHLWFDRPIADLPHAVLVEGTAQWLFSRGRRDAEGAAAGAAEGAARSSAGRHYYQVVISASRDLAGEPREQVRNRVLDDLAAIWPETRVARLEHWRMTTEHDAVFSVVPGLDALRPSQQTSVENLMLAGDWTRTGWPATMEGAVRSGNLAAEAVLRLGQKSR